MSPQRQVGKRARIQDRKGTLPRCEPGSLPVYIINPLFLQTSNFLVWQSLLPSQIIRRLGGIRWVDCQMGICNSSESTNLATAKLISHDGTLREFSYPVKVSYALLKNPTCFICCSDELEFNDAVSAIDEDEELQLGQIYFALPLSQLKRPLQAEQMAALAVKASSALAMNGQVDKSGCRRISVASVIISAEDFKLSRRGDAGGCVVGAPGGKDGRKRKMFRASLSAIAE